MPLRKIPKTPQPRKRDPGGKQSAAYKALKTLPEEVQKAVETQLTSGVGALTVARWIQKENGLLLDKKEDTLKRMLLRYTGELRDKILGNITLAHRNLALSTVVKRLNAMDELDALTSQQKYRVEQLLLYEGALREEKLEKYIEAKALRKQTSDEIKLLKDLLVDLGRMQLETGVLARAPRTVTGQLTDANGDVQAFTWTEEQESLFRELENVEATAATA